MPTRPEAKFIISADDKSRAAIRSVQSNLQGLEGRFKSVARSLASFAVGIGGAFLAKKIVDATIEQENALRQLEQRIKSTGGVAGLSRKQFEEMASGLQKVTTFGDEAILAMQGILLTFTNIRGQAVQRTTEAVLDLSVAMGQDLKSSAVQLGKALNDPIKNLSALSRTGIQFTKEQEKVIKSLVETGRIADAQNIILDELQRQFGGAARAAADTFGGAIQQLQNAFGDLLEAPGGMEDAKESLQELTRLLQDPATVSAANALTSSIITGFTGVTKAISGTVNFVRFFGEEWAAAFGDIAADDIPRLEDRLQELTRLRDASIFNVAAAGERLRFFGKDGIVEWYSDEDLTREINKILAQLAVAYAGTPPLLPATNSATAAPVSSSTAPVVNNIDALKVQEQLILDNLSAQERANNEILRANALWQGGLLSVEAYAEQVQKAAKAFDVEETENKRIEALKVQEELILDNLSAQERANNEILRANALWQGGLLSVEAYTEQVQAAAKAFEPVKDELNQLSVFAEQAGRNIQDSFADFLFDPFDKGLKGMLESFGDILRRMVAEAASAQLLQSLGNFAAGSANPFGQAIGALFGGTRDSGGRGYPGMAYAIGTGAQPEVFVPDSPGTFYPRGQGMPGAGNITVNQTLPRGSAAETRRAAGAGLRDAMGLINRAARYA